MGADASFKDSSAEVLKKQGKTIKSHIWIVCKLIYSLFMAFMGLVALSICLFTVFRHGGWLAEISILEFLWFFWLLYCLHRLRKLAVEEDRSVFLYIWRIFKLMGNILFFALAIFIIVLFITNASKATELFFASNSFEILLLLIVAIASGLVVVMGDSSGKEKNKGIKSQDKGELV